MIKRRLLLSIVLFIAVAVTTSVTAQCSICTKTAGQLGEKKAAGLNTGIIYLMFAPFAIAGYIGFRWWKNEKLNAF